jgi:hypothetical protein
MEENRLHIRTLILIDWHLLLGELDDQTTHTASQQSVEPSPLTRVSAPGDTATSPEATGASAAFGGGGVSSLLQFENQRRFGTTSMRARRLNELFMLGPPCI